jgi:hypothetical protein
LEPEENFTSSRKEKITSGPAIIESRVNRPSKARKCSRKKIILLEATTTDGFSTSTENTILYDQIHRNGKEKLVQPKIKLERHSKKRTIRRKES